MATPENVPDLFDAAADLIEARGWIQGQMFTGQDWAKACCVEGGLWAAAGVDPASHYDAQDPAVRLAYEAEDVLAGYLAGMPVEEFYPKTAFEVNTEWNDAPDQTAAVVVARLRECALLERGRTDA